MGGIDAEELARTFLVRLIPSGYRLVGRDDSRLAAVHPNAVRIALRHLGPKPSLVIFSGPGQDAMAAARDASAWAAATFRPNAIQRRVTPGVVVVGVGERSQLPPAGMVPGTAAACAIWTVDSASGQVEAWGTPSGAPSGGLLKGAARTLARGAEAPPLGALVHAERNLMSRTTRGRWAAAGFTIGIWPLLFILYYGGGFLLRSLGYLFMLGPLLRVFVILALGAGAAALLAFDVGGLRSRLPGFSSPRRGVAWTSWTTLAAVVLIVALAFGLAGATGRPQVRDQRSCSRTQCTVNQDDDGSTVILDLGGTVTIDLTGAGPTDIHIDAANPATLQRVPGSHLASISTFRAAAPGRSEVVARSSSSGYSFSVTIVVQLPPSSPSP